MTSTSPRVRRRVPLRAAAAAVAVALALGTVTALPAAAGDGRTAGDVVYDGTRDRIDGSVYRLYRAFFLREPDADGLVYWLTQARWNRYPVSSIANDFARSEEFRARYGAVGNEAFIDLVYRNVMERHPDAGGRAYWLDHLNRGMPRGHVMIYFSDSVEFGYKVGAGPFGTVDHRGPAEPAPSAPAGSYAFASPNPNGTGRPLGWAPCQPIYVAVNPTGIAREHHDAFIAMVRETLAAVSAATGQDWVYVGRTAFRARDAASSNAWPNLVSISFRSDTAADLTHGSTRVDSAANPSTGTVTHAFAAINLHEENVVGSTGPSTYTRLALLHELGRAAGLDVVDDPDQVMYRIVSPSPVEPAYGPGDLAGLARAGSVTTAC